MNTPPPFVSVADFAELKAIVKLQAENINRLIENEEQRDERINDILARVGKPDWSMLGVVVLVGISMVGFFFFGPVGNLEKADTRQAEELASLDIRLTGWIRAEQERNNRIERELGGVTKVNELFQAGKLKLD